MAANWEQYSRSGRHGEGRRSAGYQTNSYVEGNTVRKAEAVPKRRERQEPKRRPERQPAAMPGISGRNFIFLAIMLTAVICTGFSYLSTQGEVRKLKKKIVVIQSDIAEMREENDAEYQEIINSVDIAEIYERATKKLKMVQAKNNQIYTYDNRKSDMVKQYADIPGVDN